MTSTAKDPAQTAYQQRLAAAANSDIGGREFCHQLSLVTDRWVRELARQAIDQHPVATGFALLAIGGYGRGELSPFSDLDIVLVHTGDAAEFETFAGALWYPIWDRGLQLGHAVRHVDEHIQLAAQDLDTATALLTTRTIFGDDEIGQKVIDAGWKNWTDNAERLTLGLRDRVLNRQRDAGDVAYILEPDLKNGHGGIRDCHSIWWAEAGDLKLTADDNTHLNANYDVLLDARVALHRATQRPGDVLRLDLQDAAAAQAQMSADELMAQIAAAARHIAWLSDELWSRVGKQRTGTVSTVAPGLELIDGEIELSADANPQADPTYMLRIATAAARHHARIGRASLDRLSATIPQWPAKWPVNAVSHLVALLLEGHAAIPVIESLDQASLISRMLPEWEPNRSRPQRNAYHRFTVDRHLWEAAANAAELTTMVSRPDLLVLGALFHDIGKGYPGDHTEVGMSIVADIAPRLGLNEADTNILVKMVEHHLLLPDVAVRRDVSDPVTIEHVAAAVGSLEVLELLHALTIADSKATGPAAWGSWKEELVNDLVTRVSHVVRGGDVQDAAWTLFPDADTLAAMAAGLASVNVRDEDRLVVVYVDLPGAFYRTAGALSLYGLDVVTARVHSEEPQLGRVAMGAAEIRVEKKTNPIEWDQIMPDLERALKGQLAIDARLVERARTYRHTRKKLQAKAPITPAVLFDDDASSNATVIEVRAPTRIGILYAITKAIAGTGCDLRHANVQTIGMDVVDSFYVRDWNGQLVTDPAHRAEIVKAVLHAIG